MEKFEILSFVLCFVSKRQILSFRCRNTAIVPQFVLWLYTLRCVYKGDLLSWQMICKCEKSFVRSVVGLWYGKTRFEVIPGTQKNGKQQALNDWSESLL